MIHYWKLIQTNTTVIDVASLGKIKKGEPFPLSARLFAKSSPNLTMLSHPLHTNTAAGEKQQKTVHKKCERVNELLTSV